jgi:hypothetical protein
MTYADEGVVDERVWHAVAGKNRPVVGEQLGA